LAEVRPFPGMHYNGSMINDLAAVICPPYDIIPPRQQQELHLRNEYNCVRLEFGRELPQDTTTDNKYTRAAATQEQWLKQGILQIDETPAVYLHDHYFTHRGKEYKRRGLIAAIRLEEWDRMVIRPHEGTMMAPKSDRLSLLWALQANTSPILTLYEDSQQRIASLLATQQQGQPLLSSRKLDGERHDVWVIKAPDVVNQISSSFAGQPLYIADGHHRYESALNYQRERRACSPSASEDEPFNFVMMTLVSFSDPGLLILPTHRLVRGIPKATLDGLMTKLKLFFDIDELPIDSPDDWKHVDDLLTGTNKIRLALFGLTTRHLLVLTLCDPAQVNPMMPNFHSDLYKRLAVSIADHVILEKLLTLSSDSEKANLTYTDDRVDAINRVVSQEYQLALLLSPARAEAIKAIADVGDKMPRKSTYFYPKLPAGLVFHRLV